MSEIVAEPPTTTEAALLNPVIPDGIDLSKQIFREAMDAEKSKPTEPEIPVEPPTPVPPITEPVVPKKDDTPVVETTTSDKSKIPAELISGKKSEPPPPGVDDAITELDAMVLPKNAKPEQVASFSKLKEQAKKVIEEKVGRIRELETKTSDGSTRAEIEAAQERVKTAETRAKELESTIERIAFTESPRFKQFLTDESATLTSAKAYFEGTDINPEIVEYAARVGGAQRVKILKEAGLDAELIASVQPYLADFDKIQRYKAGALENWKAESAQMSEARKAQQEAAITQRRAEEDKVWDGVASRLKTEIAAFRKFDANDDWNKRSDELVTEWKRVYNGENVDLETVADYLGKGIAFDAEHEIRMAVTEELNKAIAENSKLKAAKPGGSNGQIATAHTNGENLSPIEQSKRTFNAELAKVQAG